MEVFLVEIAQVEVSAHQDFDVGDEEAINKSGEGVSYEIV